MMIVENELTTPLGIALDNQQNPQIPKAGENVRGKHTDEDKDSLGVCKALGYLRLVERLVLDAHLIPGDALDGDETLAVVQEAGVGGSIGENDPDDN